MSRKYKFKNPAGIYFISFAVVNWINVFTKEEYFKTITDSLRYCRINKGMLLYAYCIMPNHIHLIFQDKFMRPYSLIQDFKKYTAKQVLKAIQYNIQESRRDWLIAMFKDAGKRTNNVQVYQFWQHHNKPIELWSEHIIKQKFNYLHNNPVKAGFVVTPTCWKYSSARNYSGDNTILEIDLMSNIF